MTVLEKIDDLIEVAIALVVLAGMVCAFVGLVILTVYMLGA
tara:strand:+ start:457 stop:579 length:123 start_codon:yes stop_codon:yes gene_type:complete